MINLTDGRQEVPLDLTDAELLVLFKKAHEADMTFNNFVEKVLKDFLDQIEYDNLLNKLDGASIDELVPRPWPYPS
jgi:hypothetical protein